MRGEEWDVRLRGKKDRCARKRVEQRNGRKMWQRDSRDFFLFLGPLGVQNLKRHSLWDEI
jgi:hypothetical protein